MAFFFCLSAMAQVELGDIKFSLADGKKISPTTGKITVTFPNVTGVDDPTSTTFVLEGNFGNDDLAFPQCHRHRRPHLDFLRARW